MRLLLTAIFTLALAGCPAKEVQSPDVGQPDAAPEVVACEWVEALSGRFYMEPPSAWLNVGVVPLSSDQAHWWVDVQIQDGVCKADGEPVDAAKALNQVREKVLGELVALELLPSETVYWSAKRSGVEIHVFPRELYWDGVWQKMVEKNLAKRLNGKQSVSGISLRVEYRAKKTSTGKWWKEHQASIKVGNANE